MKAALRQYQLHLSLKGRFLSTMRSVVMSRIRKWTTRCQSTLAKKQRKVQLFKIYTVMYLTDVMIAIEGLSGWGKLRDCF